MGATSPSGAGRAEAFHPWLWAGAACLLAAPAVAMWLEIPGVRWSVGDFVVMGLMLAAACALVELGLRCGSSWPYRAGFGLATLTGFLTVWVNLAVGMLGDEGDPANLMFAAVLAMAVVGALVARLRAAGMAGVMAAAGGMQLLAVAGAAAAGGFGARELALSAAFAVPWLAAAGLFGRAHVAGRGRSQ